MGEASLAGVSIVRSLMVQRVSPQVLSPGEGLVAARILARVFLHGELHCRGKAADPGLHILSVETISVRGRLL